MAGTPLAVRASEVQTVHSRHVAKEDGTIALITVVYSEKLGNFEVEESFDQVIAQLNPEPKPESRIGLQWLKNYRAKI